MTSTDATYTIGIDIGGTNLRAGLVDASGQIVDSEQVPTPSTTHAMEQAICTAVDALTARHDSSSISAVGLAIAGFLDADCQRVRFAPHLPWRDAPVQQRLSTLLGRPVVIEHDANSAAWGEHYVGGARGVGNWVLFAIGTGIGAAVMQEGEIFRGAYGTAPELGHLTVMPQGRQCPCGKRGCLERYCSGSALALGAQDRIATGVGPHSALSSDYATRAEELTGRVIVREARAGDALARAVVNDMATWLGRGLALVQDVFDPELIIIGGGVSADADLFLPVAERILAESIVGAGHRPVARVQQATLGGDAGMIGVALRARVLHGGEIHR